MNPPRPIDLTASPEPRNSAALFKGYSTFHGSHEFSDLTIICGTRRWKVHKVVMSANASYFRKACSGSFKEGKAGTIELQEDEPHAIAAMIYYLYHGSYDVQQSKAPAISDHVFHLQVYLAGDKYGVTGLPILAKNRLFALFNLKEDSDGFAEAIQFNYQTDLPSHEIQKKALDTIRPHRSELFNTSGAHTKFNEVARLTPNFMYDLLQMDAVAAGSLARRLNNPYATSTELRVGGQRLRDEITALDEETAGHLGRLVGLEHLLIRCNSIKTMAETGGGAPSAFWL